jgi:hypothetical protein
MKRWKDVGRNAHQKRDEDVQHERTERTHVPHRSVFECRHLLAKR